VSNILNFRLTLEDLLGPKLAALAAKVEKFGHDVEKPHDVKVNTSKAEGGLGSLMGMAGKAFAAFGIFEGVKGIVKMGSDLEQTQVQFETFTGSAEKGKAAIADLQKFAQITPFDDEQVISAGRQLLAFGEDASSLTPILTKLGNISSATGKDINELTSIYGKNKLSGIIQGEDLNQLTQAGIPVMDSLARQLHVTTSEVKKMGADGKISFGMLDKAFDELGGAGGKWGDLMDKQSKTFAGRLSGLLGFVQNLGGKIGLALTPGLGKLVDAGNAVMTFVSKNTDKIITMFKPVQEALQPLLDAFGQIYAELGLTGDGTDFLTGVFNGLATVIKFLSPVIAIAAKAIGEVYLKVWHLVQAIAKFIETSPRLQKFFAGVWASAVAVFKGIAEAATKFLGGTADILEGVFTLNWAKLKTGLRDTLMAVGSGGAVAEKAGAAFGEGYSKGFQKSTLFDVAKAAPAAAGAPGAFLAGKKTAAAASLAPSLKEKAGTAGANGGSKVTNIAFNVKQLIGSMTVQAATVTEGAEQVADIVVKKIFAGFNDVNTLASSIN
jgi:tape measure domain-containing protein